MTGLQELQDDALGLEAQLWCKRLEIAQALGDIERARYHRMMLNSAIQDRRDLRARCAMDDGCFFDASGESDAIPLNHN
jgi:hypothetical protein